MPDFQRSLRIERLKAAMDRLVMIGWIERYVIHDSSGACVVHWTEKGRERARQVIEIVTEFHGGADDLMALAAICRAHPPE